MRMLSALVIALITLGWILNGEIITSLYCFFLLLLPLHAFFFGGPDDH